MKIINWTLLFLAAFFCCFDSVKANPLRQDTIRDVPYQLYPLGVACRDLLLIPTVLVPMTINFIRWGLPAVTMIWQP